MSVPVAAGGVLPASATPPPPAASWRHPSIAVGIAVGEWLVGSVVIDLHGLLARVAGPGLAEAGNRVYLLAFAVAVAWLLVAGPGVRRRNVAGPSRRRSAWAHVGLVALSFATLLAAGGGVAAGPRLAALVAVGLVAGVASLGALATWAGLGVDRRRARAATLFSAAVGVPAWYVAERFSRAWGDLQALTLEGAAAMLRLVAPGATVDGPRALLGLEGFTVHVARSCSGYEGVGLVVAVTAGYVVADRRGLDLRRAWLVPFVAALAIFLLNLARIAALVWLGARVSPELALAGFHSKAGWVASATVALGAVALARRWTARGLPEAAAETHPAVPFLAPLLVLVGASMLTGLFAVDVDRLEVLALAAAAGTLVALRRRLPALRPARPLVAAALGVAAYALWVALEPAPDPARAGASAAALAALPAGERVLFWAVRVAVSVVVVPFAEELAFRGYLLRRLDTRGPFEARALSDVGWLALALSSLAFGLLHGRWIRGTLAGLGFGLAARHGGRLGDAVLAHAVANGLLAAHVALTGELHFWL